MLISSLTTFGTIILPAIGAAVSLLVVLWASPLVFFSILGLALVALALAWPRRDRIARHYPTPKRPAVPLAGAHNFRDLGGIPTADAKHRVRAGVLFRSDALSRLTPGDVAYLDQHIRPRLIVDLRDGGERRAAPNRLSQSAPPRSLELPVGRGMESTLSHKALKSHLMAGTIAATDAEMAQAMIDLTHRLPEHAAERWAQMFDALLESNGTPAVIHCTAGKDRTGIAVALILLACGVSVDEVLDDYEASNAHNAYHLAKLALAIRIASRGWTRRGQLDGLFVVRRATLAGTLAGLEARHGTVAAFLSAKVGLTPDKVQRLRALLLEPAN